MQPQTAWEALGTKEKTAWVPPDPFGTLLADGRFSGLLKVSAAAARDAAMK